MKTTNKSASPVEFIARKQTTTLEPVQSATPSKSILPSPKTVLENEFAAKKCADRLRQVAEAAPSKLKLFRHTNVVSQIAMVKTPSDLIPTFPYVVLASAVP